MRAFGFVACLFVLLSIVSVVDAAETVAGKSLKQWSADLQSENQTTRLRAAKTLGIFGESAGDVFNQMLDHDDVSVVYHAASHIGDSRVKSDTVAGKLTKLLGHEHASVQVAAAYALCRIDGVKEKYAAVLNSALASKERGAACSAAEMYQRIGPAASQHALAALKAAQQNNDYHVKGAVINALRMVESNPYKPEPAERPKMGGRYRTWLNAKSVPRPELAGDNKRLNILWISCEDISPNLGCYGDEYASTPNLDRLAEQGMRFSQAFTPAGVCAVVRSGIITGMYPISIGSQHMRSRIVTPDGVRCFSEYLREAGYFCTNKSKTDYQFDSPVTAWDRQGGNHQDWRDRAPGQPFFSIINLTISHESQIRHSHEVHKQVLAQLDSSQHHDPNRAGKFLPPIYPNTPATRMDWAFYQDNISAMDKQVGQVLKRLDEDGLSDNTIVIFWSDHGRGLPRGKRWIYDSGTHIPFIVRWPGQIKPSTVNDELVNTEDLTATTLALAGIERPDYMHGRVIVGEQKDPAPEYIYFHRDRMDEAYELMRGCRDHRFKYIRNYEPQKPYAQHISYMDKMPTLRELRRMDIEGTLKGAEVTFMRKSKPVEELYDIVHDPHETVNLAAKAKYKDVLTKMRNETIAWQDEIGDLGLVPEPIMMENMRPGNQMQRTAKPEIVREGDTVTVKCATPGASIQITQPNMPARLYNGSFKTVGQVRAVATRIGFQTSEAVVSNP